MPSKVAVQPPGKAEAPNHNAWLRNWKRRSRARDQKSAARERSSRNTGTTGRSKVAFRGTHDDYKPDGAAGKTLHSHGEPAWGRDDCAEQNGAVSREITNAAGNDTDNAKFFTLSHLDFKKTRKRLTGKIARPVNEA
jgi:hypothetical protein